MNGTTGRFLGLIAAVSGIGLLLWTIPRASHSQGAIGPAGQLAYRAYQPIAPQGVFRPLRPNTAEPRPTATWISVPPPTATPWIQIGPGVPSDERYSSCSRVVTIDERDDGTIDFSFVETFGADGRLQQRVITSPASGAALETRTYRYTDGWLVDIEARDPTDVVTERTSLLYDGEQHLTDWVVDRQADGRIEYRITYTYGQGLLTRQTLDISDDGRPDQITRYDYDDSHLLHQVSVDEDADGTDEIRYVYIWGDGFVVRREHWGEPSLVAVERFRYDDPGGAMTLEELDMGGDGTPDVVQRRGYDADRGILLRHEWFEHGGMEKLMEYGYDALSRVEVVRSTDFVSQLVSVERHRVSCR